MKCLTLEQYANMASLDALLFEQQPDWLKLLHQYCFTEDEIRVYVSDEGNVAVPLVLRSQQVCGFTFRWLEGVTALYSSHYRPAGSSAEELDTLLRDIVHNGGSDGLRFSCVDEDDPLVDVLKGLAAERALTLSASQDFEHWFLPLEHADYAAYSSGLPSILRNTLKRKGNRVRREFQVRFEVVRDEKDLPAALDAYQSVYGASWKESERYAEFIPQLCKVACRHGWLRLGVLWLNDKPVASQIWFVVNGRASIFKLAYDSDYHRWSVGSLLTAELMRQVIDVDRVTEVEFGKGGEAYKRDWMSGCRQRLQLDGFRTSTLSGRMMALRHQTLPLWRRRCVSGMNRIRN